MLPYRDSYKKELLPFTSKDIITLTINRFDRMFDISSLMKKKVLIKVFPLHDNNDLNFINQTNTVRANF